MVERRIATGDGGFTLEGLTKTGTHRYQAGLRVWERYALGGNGLTQGSLPWPLDDGSAIWLPLTPDADLSEAPWADDNYSDQFWVPEGWLGAPAVAEDDDTNAWGVDAPAGFGMMVPPGIWTARGTVHVLHAVDVDVETQQLSITADQQTVDNDVDRARGVVSAPYLWANYFGPFEEGAQVFSKQSTSTLVRRTATFVNDSATAQPYGLLMSIPAGRATTYEITLNYWNLEVFGG